MEIVTTKYQSVGIVMLASAEEDGSSIFGENVEHIGNFSGKDTIWS